MASDLAAADDFVNELASSEAPGCRLPVLTQLLQCPETRDAVKVCGHLTVTTSSALSTNPAGSRCCARVSLRLAYEYTSIRLLHSRWCALGALGASWCSHRRSARSTAASYLLRCVTGVRYGVELELGAGLVAAIIHHTISLRHCRLEDMVTCAAHPRRHCSLRRSW